MKPVGIFTFYNTYKDLTFDCVNSVRHFHPDVPVHVYDWDECKKVMAESGCIPQTLFAELGRRLALDYKTVIHIDGDSLVTAPINRAFDGWWDVAGVRNNNDLGRGQHYKTSYTRTNRLTGDPIPVDSYCNCGFFAVKNPAFWADWAKANKRYGEQSRLGEQDTFNDLVWSGKYQAMLLDPRGSEEYWGTSNQWGEQHLESWKRLRIEPLGEHPRICLDGPMSRPGDEQVKRVRILHLAAGQFEGKEQGWDHPWVRRQVPPGVMEYLDELRA